MRAEIGQATGQPCPKCGTEIIYNGNYFCPENDWVLDPEKPEATDRVFQACFVGLMKRRYPEILKDVPDVPEAWSLIEEMRVAGVFTGKRR